MKHYEHIEAVIVEFFKGLGIDVEIEPSGSRGPDVRGINVPLIGEIKHVLEQERDLKSFYWSSWNSQKQKFGGKTLAYQIRSSLPGEVDNLSDIAKGWVAVLWGQLRYMVRHAGLSEGWVIYEDHQKYEVNILEAVTFLSAVGFVRSDIPAKMSNVGFLRILYLN